MTGDELVGKAQADYGSLVSRVFRFPDGLGIDVHLIGGEVVQYFPSGERYIVDQPSAATKARRWWSRLIGSARRLRPVREDRRRSP